MKKLVTLIIALVSVGAFAQSSGFGIKGGLNYSSNGDLIKSVSDAGQNVIQGADAKVGYHIGFFGKIKLPIVYLRPELVYTTTSSEYEGDQLKIQKIDAPVLVGTNIVGPLHIFAGPAFQYILDNDFKLSNVTLGDVKNDFSVGLNVGLGVNLGNLGLDVRYERGFSENEVSFIQNNGTDSLNGRYDTRPSQIIFSLSVKL